MAMFLEINMKLFILIDASNILSWHDFEYIAAR